MKIYLTGGFNAEILARQLRYFDVEAHAGGPVRFLEAAVARGFDIIYDVYFANPMALALALSKSLGKKFVVHFVGSDAFDYTAQSGFQKILLNFALRSCDQLLYVTEDLRRLIGLRGHVAPIPIDTRMFREGRYDGEKRDILYYCPHPHEIYRVDWIVEYAKSHPNETITVLGYDHPIRLPNVKVIQQAEYGQMPQVYSAHRCLIRMTTEDGYPKMPYEALLCGLEVFWNGEKITRVPNEMLMENTIPKIIAILESMK